MSELKTPFYAREIKRSWVINRKTGVMSNFSSQINSEYIRGYNTRSYINNSNWRQIMALGGDASQNYTRSEYRELQLPYTHGQGGVVYGSIDKACECSIVHPGGGFASVYSGEDATLRDQALARFKRKLQSHYGNKNLMTPVAELRDLHRTIRGVTGMSTNLVKDLLLIRKTKGKSALRYAGDAWLSFSFGVKPLLNDVSSAARAVQDYLTRQDHTFRITGTASRDWLSSRTETGETAMLSASLTTRTELKHLLSYKYVGGFNIKPESGNNYGVFSHFGVTFKDLIPTAWELVPYSWVVDYFTTAGDFLDDTFVIPEGDLKYLLVNRRYTCKAKIRGQLIGSISPGFFVRNQSNTPGGFQYFSFSRTRLATLPRRSLRFRTFDEVGSHAVSKLLNLSSLLVPGRRR